ncbi:MAG: hypothetical protein ABI402_15335 [Ferruginibacter sp.]
MHYIEKKCTVINSHDFKPCDYKNLERGTFSIIPAFAKLNPIGFLPVTLSLSVKMIVNEVIECSYTVNYRYLMKFIDNGDHRLDIGKLLKKTELDFMDKLLLVGYYSELGFNLLQTAAEILNLSIENQIIDSAGL